MINLESLILLSIFIWLGMIALGGLIYIAYSHITNKMVVIEDTNDVDELEYIDDQIDAIEELMKKTKDKR